MPPLESFWPDLVGETGLIVSWTGERPWRIGAYSVSASCGRPRLAYVGEDDGGDDNADFFLVSRWGSGIVRSGLSATGGTRVVRPLAPFQAGLVSIARPLVRVAARSVTLLSRDLSRAGILLFGSTGFLLASIGNVLPGFTCDANPVGP
jgi:hypothetical protein